MNHSSYKKKAVIIVALVTAVLGIIISLYSLVHHYRVEASGKTDAFCNISEKLNCDAVASSEYSEIFNIPLGGWGIAFFSACVFLIFGGFTFYRANFLTLGMAKKAEAVELARGFLLFTGVGIFASIILFIISYFAVGTLCPTCILVYVATFVLFGCALFLNAPYQGFDINDGVRGAMYATIPVVMLLVATFGMDRIRAAKKSQMAPTTADRVKIDETIYRIPISTSPYMGLGEDYRKGSDSAKVTLIEFVDFECPACRQLSGVLKEVYKQYGDTIRIVFKNFPLNNSCNPEFNSAGHKHACNVAILARCAGQYGKFWQYHDIAFDRQSQLNDNAPKAWAKEIGLSDDQISQCLASQDHKNKIADDCSIASRSHLEGTPTLYINGKKYNGIRDAESISSEIAKQL